MDNPQWNEVDRYFDEYLVRQEPVLGQAVAASASAGLPTISVAPNQGKLLMMLARMVGARRILEVGTLGGYSAIWMARALPPDGQLISLEVDPHHASVAEANVSAAGLSALITIRVGPALDTLPKLADEGAGPFDLIFIDADKTNNAAYLDWAVKLSRPGSVIVVDNVVRDGAVANSRSRDSSVTGSRRVIEAVGAHPRLTATALQTVGIKGYDGFLLALVTA